MIRGLQEHTFQIVASLTISVVLIMVGMQGVFLMKLRTSSEAVKRQAIRSFLMMSANEVEGFYNSLAVESLALRSSALTHLPAKPARNVERPGIEGVKKFFVVDATQLTVPKFFLYDSTRQPVQGSPDPREIRAIQIACSPILLLRQPEVPIYNEAHNRDPENRIVLTPIYADNSSRVLYIAGIILDNAYFEHHYLPNLIGRQVSKFFPGEETNDIVVSVYDRHDHLVYSTKPYRGSSRNEDEITDRWGFFHDGWYLQLQMRRLALGTWAERSFIVTLSLSLLLGTVVIGATLLGLRTGLKSLKLAEMKSDLLCNISHELRTPLSSIHLFSEFLRLGRVKDPEKISAYGSYIEAEGQRLERLVDRVLQTARLESGSQYYQFEEVNIAEVVTDTLNMLELPIVEGGFNFLYHPPQETMPSISADRSAVAEVLFIILDNAVKYSGTGKDISIRLARDNGYIKVLIADHGIGIPTEEKKKVFDQFYRVGHGLEHGVKGYGLGLSIAKKIVEAHQGKLTVESALGEGSTFTIQLPVSAATNHV